MVVQPPTLRAGISIVWYRGWMVWSTLGPESCMRTAKGNWCSRIRASRARIFRRKDSCMLSVTQGSAAPTQRSVAPAQRSAAHAQRTAARAQRSATRAQRSTTRAQRSTAHAQRSAAPTQISATRAQTSATPAQRSATPLEEHPSPTSPLQAPLPRLAASETMTANLNPCRAQGRGQGQEEVHHTARGATQEKEGTTHSTAATPPPPPPHHGTPPPECRQCGGTTPALYIESADLGILRCSGEPDMGLGAGHEAWFR